MTGESSPPADDAERAARERQAWESIVSELQGQLDLPGYRSAADRDKAFIDALLDGDPPAEASGSTASAGDDGEAGHGLGHEHDGDDFRPADPGPIPMPADALSRMGWAGALGGPVLVGASYVLGLGSSIAAVGVAAFVIGFITLVVRLPDHRDDGDGAVV
ncbi:MAG: hypothetical protein KGP12_08380 [Actinomycetales bacterium]|nr:hypothetical protein [Actinomycetales bacterium]